MSDIRADIGLDVDEVTRHEHYDDKGVRLLKTQRLVGLHKGPSPDIRYMDEDWDLTVELGLELYDALGQPDVLTVLVEPGDTLND